MQVHVMGALCTTDATLVIMVIDDILPFKNMYFSNNYVYSGML